MKAIKKIKWERVITNIQGKVLEGLGRYRFLTLRQMLDLGVGTTQYKYLWEQVRSLRDRKRALVRCHRYENPAPRKGRVEDMYFLTPVGKEVLITELLVAEEQIKMPIGTIPAYKDYFHRKYTIDVQILLDSWAKNNEVSVRFFHTYFDMTGDNRVHKNLQAKTKVYLEGEDYFIPDGVFQLERGEETRLVLFEMYNGKNSGRVIEQLHKHALALTERHTHRQFGYDLNKSYPIMMVFEFDSIKRAVVEKAKREVSKHGVQSFSRVEQYFISKSLEELKAETLNEHWTTLFGNKRVLW